MSRWEKSLLTSPLSRVSHHCGRGESELDSAAKAQWGWMERESCSLLEPEGW